MKAIWLIVALLSGLGLAHGAKPKESQKEAMPETGNEVKVFTNMRSYLVKPIVAQFEAIGGPKIKLIFSEDLGKELQKPNDYDALWLNDLSTLETLPSSILQTLPTKLKAAAMMPIHNRWVPLHARFGTLIISRDRLKSEQMPKSVLDLPKMTQLKGKLGWAITSDAFTDLVASIMAKHGEAKAREWIAGMQKLEPQDYGNEQWGIIQAINNGKLDAGISQHHWINRVRSSGFRVAMHAFAAGDVGNVADGSSAAVIKNSSKVKEALQFVEYLTSPGPQLYIYSSRFEQPLHTKNLHPGRSVSAKDLNTLSPRLDLSIWRAKARELLIALDLL